MSNPEMQARRQFDVPLSAVASTAAIIAANTWLIDQVGHGKVPEIRFGGEEQVETTAVHKTATPWLYQPGERTTIKTTENMLSVFVPGTYAAKYDDDPATAQPRSDFDWKATVRAIHNAVNEVHESGGTATVSITGWASAEATDKPGGDAGLFERDNENAATALARASAAAEDIGDTGAARQVVTGQEDQLINQEVARVGSLPSEYGYTDHDQMMDAYNKGGAMDEGLRHALDFLIAHRRGVEVSVYGEYAETRVGAASCTSTATIEVQQRTEHDPGHSLPYFIPVVVPIFTRRKKPVQEQVAEASAGTPGQSTTDIASEEAVLPPASNSTGGEVLAGGSGATRLAEKHANTIPSVATPVRMHDSELYPHMRAPGKERFWWTERGQRLGAGIAGLAIAGLAAATWWTMETDLPGPACKKPAQWGITDENCPTYSRGGDGYTTPNSICPDVPVWKQEQRTVVVRDGQIIQDTVVTRDVQPQ